MRKRSTTALIAALIVVAIGFFASFFLSFTDSSGERYTITLPGQGSAVIDPSPEIGQSNRGQLQTVQVDRSNIQAVVNTLRRPDRYHYQSETSYFFGENKATLQSQVWKDGSYIRISQLQADQSQGQQILMSDHWVYLWGQEGVVSRYARQSRDADLYNRAPSYEDLLSISAENILEGSVTELEGQLCLYAKSRDALTGEVEQWYILVENGLLLYADGTLDGQMTYQTQITDLQLSVDSEEQFLLPDGSQPE